MTRTTIVKRLVFRFSIALLTFMLGLAVFAGWDYIKGSPFSNELTLQLVAEKQIITVDEYPGIKLYITNHGKDTVTLVQPGDGSESAWRTPIVQWSILEARDWSQHPGVPDMKPKTRSCGNINALEWDEVFRLAPGETKEFTGHMPAFRNPGTYSVTVLYANRPLMKWLGLELGNHHPIAMWRVRHSTETTVTSNELFVTVTE